MRSVEAEVEVSASAERVWDVLTDFGSYERWNPFIVEAAGEAVAGGRLNLRMQLPGGRPMSIHPRITEADRPAVLEWLGSLGVRGLFDGRHRFQVVEHDGSCTVTQSEVFTGILVPLVWRVIGARTSKGFAELNQALKRRAEVAV